MSSFISFNSDQAFLLPPHLKAWVPDADLAHFVVAAVERVPIGAFRTRRSRAASHNITLG
jgi:hypothetical protein